MRNTASNNQFQLRPTKKQGAYRVFISYSRDDMKTAQAVYKILDQHEELLPVWDRHFAYGHGFHDQIKSFIAHAHIFMPAMNPEMQDSVNTTIVGDWFAAESVAMQGPRQTNFTTHAPSIRTRIELFDRELHRQLEKRSVQPEESAGKAIEELESVVCSLRDVSRRSSTARPRRKR